MGEKIKDRITQAIREHGEGGFLVYHKLADHVFPRADYPRAWNSPTRGGPPGCYMALSRAIREHDFYIHYGGDAVVYATVGYGKNRPIAALNTEGK